MEFKTFIIIIKLSVMNPINSKEKYCLSEPWGKTELYYFYQFLKFLGSNLEKTRTSLKGSKEKVCVCVCKCMHVCVCEHVCTCTCMCVCV